MVAVGADCCAAHDEGSSAEGSCRRFDESAPVLAWMLEGQVGDPSCDVTHRLVLWCALDPVQDGNRAATRSSVK